MFIINWVAEQALHTLIELKNQVTIPHIITGVIMYKIVHKAARAGSTTHKKRKARVKKATYKNQMQKYIARHVESGHSGHPLKCTHSECEVMKVMADPQLQSIK